jgi:hypothetical protein
MRRSWQACTSASYPLALGIIVGPNEFGLGVLGNLPQGILQVAESILAIRQVAHLNCVAKLVDVEVSTTSTSKSCFCLEVLTCSMAWFSFATAVTRACAPSTGSMTADSS